MKSPLDNIAKENIFKVPDSYFENLPMKIQGKVTSTKSENRKLLSPIWVTSMAACVIAICYITFLTIQDKPFDEQSIAKVADDDLVLYLAEGDWDEYEIYQTLENTDENLDFESVDLLNDINIEDDVLIEDVILEYDLGDKYL